LLPAGQACKKINESGLTCLITALAAGFFPTECQLKKLCSFFAGGSGYKKRNMDVFLCNEKKEQKRKKTGIKIFTKQTPMNNMNWKDFRKGQRKYISSKTV
jgi:hypothetical protein